MPPKPCRFSAGLCYFQDSVPPEERLPAKISAYIPAKFVLYYTYNCPPGDGQLNFVRPGRMLGER